MSRCVLRPGGSGRSVVTLSSAAHQGCGEGWGATRPRHHLQDTLHRSLAGRSMF